MPEDITNTEETITMTKTELEAKLQSEADKRVTDALKRKEREFSGKLKESEKLAQMNTEQKAEYERQQFEKTLADKEIELNRRENKIVGLQILSEKNIPAALIDFVLHEDATEMNSRITLLSKEIAKAVSAEVKAKLNTSNPKVAVMTSNDTTKEQFKVMSIAQKQEIFNTNKELWDKLTK
jgi:hypothetical protein